MIALEIESHRAVATNMLALTFMSAGGCSLLSGLLIRRTYQLILPAHGHARIDFFLVIHDFILSASMFVGNLFV